MTTGAHSAQRHMNTSIRAPVAVARLGGVLATAVVRDRAAFFSTTVVVRSRRPASVSREPVQRGGNDVARADDGGGNAQAALAFRHPTRKKSVNKKVAELHMGRTASGDGGYYETSPRPTRHPRVATAAVDPLAFAASVLTGVMANPDGRQGRRLSDPVDDATGATIVRLPLPPPPPPPTVRTMPWRLDLSTLGAGVVAPKQGMDAGPSPLTTVPASELQAALRRMTAAGADLHPADVPRRVTPWLRRRWRMQAAWHAEQALLRRLQGDDVPEGPEPPPTDVFPGARPSAAPATTTEVSTTAAKTPPMRVRWSTQHVVHPWTMHLLESTMASMPLPHVAAQADPAVYMAGVTGIGKDAQRVRQPPAKRHVVFSPPAFTGFTPPHLAGTVAAGRPARTSPTVPLAVPHPLAELTRQRVAVTHVACPLWHVVQMHFGGDGMGVFATAARKNSGLPARKAQLQATAPVRSARVRRAAEWRVRFAFSVALRRRGYYYTGELLAHMDRRSLPPPLQTLPPGTPAPETPLTGSVFFDGLVQNVLPIPFPKLVAFMEGVVDLLEVRLRGDAKNIKSSDGKDRRGDGGGSAGSGTQGRRRKHAGKS